MLASELRTEEWINAQDGAFVDTNPNSISERNVASLRHDTLTANHDRDYRGICISGEFFGKSEHSCPGFRHIKIGLTGYFPASECLGGLSIGEKWGFCWFTSLRWPREVVKKRWGNPTGGPKRLDAGDG